VLGNHDHWHNTIEKRHEQLAKLNARYSNLHWLEKSCVEIEGQRFIGGTLWYPEDIMAPLPMTWCDHRYVNPDEFTMITYKKITKEHEETKRYLKENVKEGDIICTHHMPSYQCVHERFVGDPWACYFATSCEDIMLNNKPSIWIAGHSHMPINLEIDDTWVVSNAYGYPGEYGADYDPNFRIETGEIE